MPKSKKSRWKWIGIASVSLITVYLITGGYFITHLETYQAIPNHLLIKDAKIYVELFGKQDVLHIPLMLYRLKSHAPYKLYLVVGTEKPIFEKVRINGVTIKTDRGKTVNLLKSTDNQSFSFKKVDHDIYGGIGNYQAVIEIAQRIEISHQNEKHITMIIDLSVFKENKPVKHRLTVAFEAKLIEGKSSYWKAMMGV